MARLTGDEITLYQAIDAALGRQDIIVSSDESVEVTGALSYLARDHRDIDGQLVARRKGSPDPVATVRFGGAAGTTQASFWRPAPTGTAGSTIAQRGPR